VETLEEAKLNILNSVILVSEISVAATNLTFLMTKDKKTQINSK